MTKQGKTEIELPRGFRFYNNDARPARPFMFQWRIDGKAKTKAFEDARSREAFARALLGDVKNDGLAALRLDPDEARAWRAFRADVGEGVDLAAVAACWRRHGSPLASMGLDDAIAAFCAAKEGEGASVAYLRHCRPTFAVLRKGLGNVSIGSVTREGLENWLAGVNLANESRRTYCRRVRSLFQWLKDARRITDNPADGWRQPKQIAAAISVLPVESLRALFDANRDRPREVLGRLALEAFAGMRHETAANLPGSAVDFRARAISVPAAIDKNRREQWIEGAPDCLWAWLAWSDPRAWRLGFYGYRNEKSRAFERAGADHPHNVLRHSFATYHIAAHGDAGKTAAILTHSSLRMLWKHYRGKGGGEDYARGWFEIYPPAAPGDFPGLIVEQIAG